MLETQNAYKMLTSCFESLGQFWRLCGLSFSVLQFPMVVAQVKQVESNGKEFFALPMERKLPVRAPDFVFGYTGGSPMKWKSKWWLEGLQIKVHRTCNRAKWYKTIFFNWVLLTSEREDSNTF